MQSLNWYAKRLRAMTPGEVIWRARHAAQDVVDRFLVGPRKRRAARQASTNSDALTDSGLTMCELPVGAWSREETGPRQRAWAQRLRARAERIASGGLRIFDRDEYSLGDPIGWNRDPESEMVTPLRFAPWIDYRDTRVAGDCKFVWEPNRHHQFVILGRAFRATGDSRYAQAAVAQWQQWLEQCPYAVGMNWRSPLELAMRLINWVWTVDLIRPCGLLTPPFSNQVLTAVVLHLRDVSRRYSRGSSANNHLIGEAAGVYIASSYFNRLPGAARWRAESRRILCNQILEQTFPDGVTREQATGYHLFVTQLFLLAGLVARHTGHGFPPEYWDRLHRMLSFVATLRAGGGALFMIGDCDDGYVLDLDNDPHDARPWLAVGATLFSDARLNVHVGDAPEAFCWLPGRLGSRKCATPAMTPKPQPLQSCAYPDAGYYILQCGQSDAADRISVVFDCGPLGFGSLAAHGHADALSFTLRAFGVDILVDPGTYDYFTYPRWRNYFRSTQAHNTVVVDNLDQSEMLGSFLWGAKAHACCIEWSPDGHGGRVRAEHDGYRRLRDPVVHRRTLELRGTRREIVVEDEFAARRRHEYCLCMHLAEGCHVRRVDGNRFDIDVGRGTVTLELDGKLDVAVLHGSESPIGGWVSRAYHRKAASTSLLGRCRHDGPLRLRTRIAIGHQVPWSTEPQRAFASDATHVRVTSQGG